VPLTMDSTCNDGQHSIDDGQHSILTMGSTCNDGQDSIDDGHHLQRWATLH
jgi:hypothetical protein